MGNFGTGKYAAFLTCFILGLMLIITSYSWDTQAKKVVLVIGILLILLDVIFLREGFRVLGRWAFGGFKIAPAFSIAVIMVFIGFILLVIGFIDHDLKIGGIGVGLMLLGGFIIFVTLD